MSRTVSATLQTAAAHASGYSPTVKARLDRSRTYFSSWTDDTGWGTEQDAGILSSAIPQTVIYSSSQSKLITVRVMNDNTLAALRSGAITTVIVKEGAANLTSKKGCKPGLREGYIYYQTDDGYLKRAVADMSKLGDVVDCITSQENIDSGISANVSGSMLPVADDEVFFVWLDDGGMRCTFYKRTGPGSWDEFESPFRYMSPETIIDDPYWTSDTAACIFDSKYFVYLSDWSQGNVYGIYYQKTEDEWSDYFEVVTEDLSDTRVINVQVANERVHLFVQFGRKEEWDTGETYNMALRSYTGLKFSTDRMTLFSKMGFRILGLVNGDTIRYVSDNRYYEETLTYWYDASTPHGTDIAGTDIISAQMQNNDQLTLILADADDSYSDNALMAVGNRLIFYAGYKTSLGNEYVKVSTHIINQISKRRHDPKGPLTIRGKSVGIFFMQDMSSPFYAELLGQSSVYDDCDELDNLYVAPNSQHTETELSIDFWGSTGFDPDGATTAQDIISDGGVIRQEPNGSHRLGFQTKTIKSHLQLRDHPEAQGTVQVSLYGWCRTKTSNRKNDNVYCYVNYEDASGVEGTKQGVLTSSYRKFPQYYYDNKDGSYPITWSVFLSKGDKITTLGFVFERNYSTIFAPEIAHISNVSFSYYSLNPNTPWKKTSGLPELQTPGSGVPFVMFSSVPYSAFNFDVEAHMYLDGDGGGSGTTEMGLVGHAEDALNMVFCRYVQQTEKWEIVKVRAGEETVLASTTSATNTDMWVRFRHKFGKYRVYAGVTPEWTDPVLSYEWTADDGPMVTNILNMHVGVRGAVLPTKFRIAGFSIDDADGIPMAGNEDHTKLNTLGSSGTLIIGNSKYSYSGKTPVGRPVGPYQGRSTWNWYEYDNGNGDFSGWATDIGLYWPDHDSDAFEDYLLAADNGHTWQISETEWAAWTKTSGTIIQLRNRSRHFGDSVHGQFVGPVNRVCISPGVLSPVLTEGPGGRHPYGTFAYDEIDHTIRLRTFRASDGIHDSNVRNMIEMAAEMSGAEALFPGDDDTTTLALTGGAYTETYP